MLAARDLMRAGYHGHTPTSPPSPPPSKPASVRVRSPLARLAARERLAVTDARETPDFGERARRHLRKRRPRRTRAGSWRESRVARALARRARARAHALTRRVLAVCGAEKRRVSRTARARTRRRVRDSPADYLLAHRRAHGEAVRRALHVPLAQRETREDLAERRAEARARARRMTRAHPSTIAPPTTERTAKPPGAPCSYAPSGEKYGIVWPCVAHKRRTRSRCTR